MPDPVAELARQASALSAEQRSRLVELLLETLHETPHADIQNAWATEIQRRLAVHEAGAGESFAAEDVFADARRIAP